MNIQLATTDRFRKAFRSFREREQKVIDSAIDTFLQDPKNPSSNFEPLSFVDENIWSIRANKDIRIIMAIFDGVYFLLHVDHHDKANDWAKTKKIDRNMATGAIQIYSDTIELVENQHAGREVRHEAQKKLFEDYSEEQLKALGVPDKWLIKIKEIATEDDFLNYFPHLPEDAIENLGLLLEGNVPVEVLIEQVRREKEEKPKEIKELVKVQPGLQLISEDSSLLEEMKKDISVFRFYLHPSQKSLAYTSANGPLKVTGGAGTGKTVVALHRAKYLAERLKEGDKPVFFTTYTKYLIKNIKSLFESQNIPREKLFVMNLHQFAMKFAIRLKIIDANPTIITDENEKVKFWERFKRVNPRITQKAGFLLEEYEDVFLRWHITSLEEYKRVTRIGRKDSLSTGAREAVWEALERFEHFQRTNNTYTFENIIFLLNRYLSDWPELKPFSHVICDEVQDFNNLELRLLRNLAPEGPDDMFLAGDPFQNIYQRRISFSHSGINIRGNRSNKLKINYRTTEEIRKFAISILKGYEFEDFSGSRANFDGDQSLVFGSEPEYLIFSDEGEEKNYLLTSIQKSFGSLGLHELCLATRTSKKVDEVYEFLKGKNIPVIKLQDVEDLKEADGKVVLSTLHGLKGLEFKTLVIYNFDQSSFPFKPQKFNSLSSELQQEYLKAEHALMYVAFSRAINQLTLTGSGKKVVIDKSVEAING